MDRQMASFRVSTTLPMAVEPMPDTDSSSAYFLTLGRKLSEDTREVLEKFSSRREAHIKEAFVGVLDALSTLEREVEMLHRRMHLAFQRIDLVDTSVSIGEHGIRVPWAQDLAESERVRVHLLVSARSARHLLTLEARRVTASEDDGVEYAFQPTDPELIDLLVAFVFEHQRRERRRELDVADLG
jgi:hypothetical protein